jgi:hypothetical protein
MRRRLLALVVVSVLALVGASARAADDEGKTTSGSELAPRSATNEVPNVGYAYTTGVATNSVGAMGYGSGLTAGGANGFGGGGTVWGSPVDRLTIVADASRTIDKQFAPSAAALVRLFGDHALGWSLAGLGKYKVDGFSRGANNEFESELEVGAVVGYVRSGLHFDFNAVTGFGLTDDREVDSEARLRLGYDVAPFLRLGIDEQARYRLSGATRLPGNRSGDFAGGAQIFAWYRNVFGAITAGPTTMNVVDVRVGWMALVSVGATAL